MRLSSRLLLALGLDLAAGGPGVGTAADLPPLRGDASPLFTADLAVSLDAEDRPALSVSLRDLGSGLVSTASEGLRVPDLPRVPLGLSDLSRGKADSAGGFTPVPARAFGLEVGDLAAGGPRWHVERSFEVTESGPPRGRDFARAMEVLSCIAEPGEVARLRSLPPAGQAAGWEEFWSRRDPDPETGRNEARVEFFRRVRYTERHFRGFGPGWRTDMGRIYIKYGPPDQVESQGSQGGPPAVEVWTYHRPFRRFWFEDRDGFGRFELVGPVFE